MFHSTHAFLFFDYFRVPYRLAGPAARALRDGDGWGTIVGPSLEGAKARTLSWPRVDGLAAGPGALPLGPYQVAGIPIFCAVAPDEAVEQRFDSGAGWRPTEPVMGPDGTRISSVWRDGGGNVLLPFDPSEVILNFWSERYLRSQASTLRVRARTVALRAYYLVRSGVPRFVQLRLRRALARVQENSSSFPRWPIEPALLDFFDWMFETVAGVAGRPVPWIAPWPDGHTWALVLTHDVETREGYENLHILREVERETGHRSSWNFVPLRAEPELRYEVQAAHLRALAEDGCEVGVHGLRHDGRDLGSIRSLEARLPIIRSYAGRWGAVGFRAPATQRSWEWMPRLGFDYDSSYPDTDPYEPQPGGCCSHLPFLNGTTVELPITLPQDHTMFAILQRPDAALWLEKARHLRERGGMALVLTHPDYADDPRLVDGYRTLLRTFAQDPSVWRALPREVAAWWRRRAASSIESDGGAWVIRGPAADEGRIRFARPTADSLAPVGGAS